MNELERLDNLRKSIEAQKAENIRLYTAFQYCMWKDEVQSLVQQWRDGSKRLKGLYKQLDNLEKMYGGCNDE